MSTQMKYKAMVSKVSLQKLFARKEGPLGELQLKREEEKFYGKIAMV